MSIVDWDSIVDTFGRRYFREVLTFDDGPSVTTLGIPGYRQLHSYTCGFTAGLSVLHTFHPRKSPEAFFNRVAPHPENGTPDARLIRALRQSGVGVRASKTLDFESICENIEAGFPIIVTVSVAERGDHWCVLYGARRRPYRSVFLAGNGFFSRKEMPWAQFSRSIWFPRGEGLVCWGK